MVEDVLNYGNTILMRGLLFICGSWSSNWTDRLYQPLAGQSVLGACLAANIYLLNELYS